MCWGNRKAIFYWIDNSSVERLCFVSKENARRIIAGRFFDRAPFGGALPNPLSQFLSCTKSHNVPPGTTRVSPVRGFATLLPSGYERKTIRNRGVSPFLPLPNLSEYSREMRL